MSFDFSFPAGSETFSNDGPRSYEQELFENEEYRFKLLEVSDEDKQVGGMECRSCYFAAYDEEGLNELARFYCSLRLPSNYDTVPSEKHWMIQKDMRVWQALVTCYNKEHHLEPSFSVDDLKTLEGCMIKGKVKPRTYTNKTGGVSWGYSILYPQPFTRQDQTAEFEAAKKALEDDIPF